VKNLKGEKQRETLQFKKKRGEAMPALDLNDLADLIMP
jgi:hypothetical protein